MADTKIVIDGQELTMPGMDTITMGEARILKRYTGKALEEIEQMQSSDPDLIAAVCHIALARDNPQATFTQLEERVNAIGLVKIQVADADQQEDDVRPPADAAARPTSDDDTSGGPSEPSSDVTLETTLPRIGAVG